MNPLNPKYEKENFSKIVKQAQSYSDISKMLGISPRGNNYKTFKKYIKEYGLDISHFNNERKPWNKGKSFTKCLDTLLVRLKNGVYTSSSDLKKRLFKYKLKSKKCEICGLEEWNGKPLAFELHHIDGNRYNNELSNLQVLCSNCHSQTDNYAGKKNIKKHKRTAEEISRSNSHANMSTRKVVRPATYEDYLKELEDCGNNYCEMGRRYGVSDNAIRKWEKSYLKYGK